MKIRNKVITLLAVAMAMVTASESVSAQTPYSKFGYGMLRDNATSAQRQMGGVGYAMSSGRQINVMNPASYAARDSLTFLFDMGLDFTNIWSSEKLHNSDVTNKQHNYGGGLDYVTMAFPVSKRLGMSIGLLPYSSVGYSFGSKIDNGSASRQGSGGLNLLYLGAGFNIVKGLNVGMNFAYFFGTTYNDVYAIPASTGTMSLFEQIIQVRDFHMDFGIQYGAEVAPRQRLTAGLTFSPGKALLGKSMVLQFDEVTSAGSSGHVGDTIASESLRHHFAIPATWGVGLNYERNRNFMAEVDFTYQGWKNAKFEPNDNFIGTKFQNRYRIGAGLQWVPDPRGSYFRRVAYRLGGYYNRDYITVNTNSVKDFGLSCGFGFPAVAGKTVVNLGFEYKHRSTSPVKLLTENYFNITLGVNFNERWFMQSKIR